MKPTLQILRVAQVVRDGTGPVNGFVVKASDDCRDRPFTMRPDDLADGEFFATIRGVALLQIDHVILDQRESP